MLDILIHIWIKFPLLPANKVYHSQHVQSLPIFAILPLPIAILISPFFVKSHLPIFVALPLPIIISSLLPSSAALLSPSSFVWKMDAFSNLHHKFYSFSAHCHFYPHLRALLLPHSAKAKFSLFYVHIFVFLLQGGCSYLPSANQSFTPVIRACFRPWSSSHPDLTLGVMSSGLCSLH